MTRYIAFKPVGVFHSIDDSSGYWTAYPDEREGGLWITDDGSQSGEWVYDEGSSNSGTWTYSDVTIGAGGYWISKSDDSMTRYRKDMIRHDKT